ncbi:MAG: AMIN domain-containing protein [Nitrospiria bacterium]
MIGRTIRIFIFVFVSGSLLSCATGSSDRVVDLSAPTKIQDIRVTEGPEQTKVEIDGGKRMIYTTFHLSDPERLVVDMVGVSLGNFNREIQINEGPISAIRPTEGEGEHVSRLEFDLTGTVSTDVRTEGVNLVVEVTQLSGGRNAGFKFFEEVEEEEAVKAAPLVTKPIEKAEVEMPKPDVKDVSAVSPKREQEGSTAKNVTEVGFEKIGSLQLVVKSDGKLFPKVFPVGKDRLVIDLPGVRTSLKKSKIPAKDPLVKQVRIGRHPKKLRLVLDLLVPVEHFMERTQNGLRLTLQKK